MCNHCKIKTIPLCLIYCVELYTFCTKKAKVLQSESYRERILVSGYPSTRTKKSNNQQAREPSPLNKTLAVSKIR